MKSMILSFSLLSVTAFAVGNATGDATLKAPSGAAGPIVIVLENHKFQPAEVHFPSGQKVVLLVKNNDPAAEEFESGALKIEKVIAGKSEGKIRIGPVEHGHYSFVGEYNEKTARGVLIAD